MTLTQQPQPTRSSLLFSPVVSSSPSSTPSDSNLTNNSPDDSEFKHHRRRSDFRSKSTDQIIPNPINNNNNPVISSTTLYPSPQSNKFSNVNVSQPTFRPAPLAPVPIPATRFDTITSYVDVIYQHQQQQQNLQNQDQNQLPMSSDQDDIEAQEQISSDDGIVYLDPSDGIDGDQSFMATCPQCTMMVMTEIAPFPGKKSKKMAFLLMPVLLCWLPYYSLKFGKKWMDVKHTCPKCQSLIAIYRK